ncbi:MAG: NAD(P)H-hydrate dehydratase [Pseudomonadota bacterium]
MRALALLTPDEMARAEANAVQDGRPMAALMEAAGAALAEAAQALAPDGAVTVLCGPGNNGGDGFVAARRLRRDGRTVRLGLLGAVDALKGDAAMMAAHYEGEVEPLSTDVLDGATLVLDCVFGTGLSRPIEGVAAAVLDAARRRAQASALRIIAADIPSGVDPATGRVDPKAVPAAKTVAFGARKPGHVLAPGRFLCGDVVLADIEISDAAVIEASPTAFLNDPPLWAAAFPRPNPLGHKFQRGHAAVLSGPRLHTGAARLAARGALRAGAGVVTLLSPADASDENAAQATAVMVREVNDPASVAVFLKDRRVRAVVHGPGAGVGEETRRLVEVVTASEAAGVFDADALTSFEAAPEKLFGLLRAEDVLTPHEGEFARIFPDFVADRSASRLAAARAAAEKAGAVVVFKGPDTTIAAPDGRAIINANAPPDLATAGAGDVLAGFIAGLRAQGMPAFDAAAAGVWLHGACGAALGPGLIAEDLPEILPRVLGALQKPSR